MDFGGQQLQYFQRLQEAGILSVQRERQRIILVEIGNENRNGNLGNIDVEEVSYNNRIGLWIEPRKKVFNSTKVKSRFEKIVPFHTSYLFNILPYNIKLSVKSEKTYDEAVKELCLSLSDHPDLSHFCEYD